MGMQRPLFFLGLALVSLIVMLEAVLTPPGERWFARTWNESRTYPAPTMVNGREDMETTRRAAEAQWELGEYYYHRGEFDSATREYQRLINDFPYLTLDYGYRADDARKRLYEIGQIRTGGRK